MNRKNRIEVKIFEEYVVKGGLSGSYEYKKETDRVMVFHPYDENELKDIIGNNTEHLISVLEDGFMLVCRKYGER